MVNADCVHYQAAGCFAPSLDLVWCMPEIFFFKTVYNWYRSFKFNDWRFVSSGLFAYYIVTLTGQRPEKAMGWRVNGSMGHCHCPIPCSETAVKINACNNQYNTSCQSAGLQYTVHLHVLVIRQRNDAKTRRWHTTLYIYNAAGRSVCLIQQVVLFTLTSLPAANQLFSAQQPCLQHVYEPVGESHEACDVLREQRDSSVAN